MRTHCHVSRSSCVSEKNRWEGHTLVPTEFGKLEDTGQRLCLILKKLPIFSFSCCLSLTATRERPNKTILDLFEPSHLCFLSWLGCFLTHLAVNSSSLLSEGKRSIRRPGLARSGSKHSKGSLRLLSASGCLAFWDAAMTVDWRTEAWVVYRWPGWFADTLRSRHQGSESSSQNWQWRTVWKKIPPGGRTWNKWLPIIPGVREDCTEQNLQRLMDIY